MSNAVNRQDAPRSELRAGAQDGQGAGVEFDQVVVIFPDGTMALKGLDLKIRDGEFVVLVGPSGCGKSTALRALAGLQPVSAGTIRIKDRDVMDLDPQARDIAMVFQNYALYPHKSAWTERLRRSQHCGWQDRVVEVVFEGRQDVPVDPKKDDLDDTVA